MIERDLEKQIQCIKGSKESRQDFSRIFKEEYLQWTKTKESRVNGRDSAVYNPPRNSFWERRALEMPRLPATH
jgi:hypothetical protein